MHACNASQVFAREHQHTKMSTSFSISSRNAERYNLNVAKWICVCVLLRLLLYLHARSRNSVVATSWSAMWVNEKVNAPQCFYSDTRAGASKRTKKQRTLNDIITLCSEWWLPCHFPSASGPIRPEEHACLFILIRNKYVHGRIRGQHSQAANIRPPINEIVL